MITPRILHNPNVNFCASIQNRRFRGFGIDIPRNLRYTRAIKRKTRQADRPERMKTMTRNEAKALQANFAQRFVIPLRTLESWLGGTNTCPPYTRLMLAKLCGL